MITKFVKILKIVNRFYINPVAYQYVKLLDFYIYYLSHDLLYKYSLLLIGYDMILQSLTQGD